MWLCQTGSKLGRGRDGLSFGDSFSARILTSSQPRFDDFLVLLGLVPVDRPILSCPECGSAFSVHQSAAPVSLGVRDVCCFPLRKGDSPTMGLLDSSSALDSTSGPTQGSGTGGLLPSPWFPPPSLIPEYLLSLHSCSSLYHLVDRRLLSDRLLSSHRRLPNMGSC